MGSTISLDYPPGFILLCLCAGFLYAWLAYSKPGSWSRSLRWSLFALRGILVSLLAFLLLSPVIRQIHNYTEKPTVVLAIDNSKSIAAVYDSARLQQISGDIGKLRDQLEDSRYQVEVRNLSGTSGEAATDYSFDRNSTDLDALLQQIANSYEGRNLSDVILVSDGIYNEGISPSFRNYPFSIQTVGVGDSVPKKDIYLDELRYNKIAYQGNKFPVQASINQHGYAGETVEVDISRDGRTLQTKNLKLGRDEVPQEVEFLLDADNTGYQHYVVSVRPKEGEFVRENNTSNAFIEIIKGKQLVYLVAASPHPDLKAIVSALESSSNYKVEQFILSLPADLERYRSVTDAPDLTILHHLPGNGYRSIDWKDRLKGRSFWMIYGGGDDTDSWTSLVPWLSIQHVRGQYDKVTGIVNPNFSAFQLSDEFISELAGLPPIPAPFGELSIDPQAAILLYERIGSIETQKPLLAVMDKEDIKSAVFLGSGLWQWKLTDYNEHKSNELFNELITKLVQYLSSRDDKRRFRVYPVSSEFNLGEDVVFETEIYNELYERIYGNKVTLSLTSPQGETTEYSYVTSQVNSRYRISGLHEGVYRFKASTRLEGQPEEVAGQVVINANDLEMMNLTANFNELRNLSGHTGGKFYHLSQFQELMDTFDGEEAQGIIHSEERYLSAINLEWLFAILLLLATTEWVLRKYQGSY